MAALPIEAHANYGTWSIDFDIIVQKLSDSSSLNKGKLFVSNVMAISNKHKIQ